MNKNELLNMSYYYEKILAKLETYEAEYPEGTLRISVDAGSPRFYQYIGEKEEKYIHANEMDIARRLAQRKYDEKVKRISEKRLGQINRLLKDYEDNEIERIFESMHPERQKLITPVEPTYSQNLEAWLAIPYEGKGFSDDAPVIKTNGGVRVRSKSEKIIADYLESVGIPYKYECPLKLKSYGTIYPDFTFLSKRTGLEIYWEHEGMMDNPEYAKSAVQKIELYEKNELYPGERLILTFETSATIINTEILKKLTKRYLL